MYQANKSSEHNENMKATCLWVQLPPYLLKFERSNFYPGNFSKLIL